MAAHDLNKPLKDEQFHKATEEAKPLVPGQKAEQSYAMAGSLAHSGPSSLSHEKAQT